MAFGSTGKDAQQNQVAQDANAAKSGAFEERAACKASPNYRSEGWDLVDAYKNAKQKVEEIKDEELPEEMKKLTNEQRKDLLETRYKERAEIQKKILELRDARNKFVAEEMKKKAETKDAKEDSLEKVMSKAVREQAEKKDFTF